MLIKALYCFTMTLLSFIGGSLSLLLTDGQPTA